MVWSQIALEMKPMLYPFAAFAFLVGIRWLDMRTSTPRRLTDIEFLGLIARRRECSEYDLFCNSAEDWQVTHQRVELDFKNYVLHDQVPFYVRDFLRRKRIEAVRDFIEPKPYFQ